MISFFLRFSVILLTLFLCSCYQKSRYEPGREFYSEDRDRFSGFPATEADRVVVRTEGRVFPWETWSRGRDLLGNSLTSVELVKGDELSATGDLKDALKFYETAFGRTLTISEKEAAAIRYSGALLASGDAKKSLSVLSEYFQSRNKSIDEVGDRFSLLFAFAYGTTGDVEQSLAWFSRVNRISAGEGGIQASAEKGVRALFRSLPENDFQKLAGVWSSDSFINGLWGQELRYRKISGPQNYAKTGPFWAEGNWASMIDAGPAASGAITVMLPLTGRYASLGKAVKQGMELAFSAEGQTISYAFSDTAGDLSTARVAMEQVAARGNTEMVIGPLLSGPSEEVANVGRRNNLPVMVMSKKADFMTGSGVYRLGPTVESQLFSLLDDADKVLGIKKFALIYPASEAGKEYAEEFKRQLADRRLELVYERSYIGGEQGYFTQIGEEVELTSAEGIFIADSIRAATRFRISLSEEGRSSIRLLGPGKWCAGKGLSHSWKVMEEAVFVCPFFADSQKLYAKRFVEAYKHQYGKKPDFLAAQGFDAATMALAAVKKAREEGSSIDFAMRSIQAYEGLTGKVSVGRAGELIRKFSVVSVQPQGLREVGISDPDYQFN